MIIASSHNERIKAIRKLQERKARAESGSFWVEGLRIVGEALEGGAEIETVVCAPDLLRSSQAQTWLEEASRRGIEVLEVSSEVFARFSAKDGPQGLAAVVRQRWDALATLALKPGQLWVALDSVADPGNLGTILRTSDGAGGAGVILVDHCTDPYDPSAVRASMGAIFSQRVVRASAQEFSAWKQATGCAMVGTSDAADVDYHTFSYPDPLILLMGSERQGMQPLLAALCDAVVSIPMMGRSDSLNLAAASAVMLYEIFNQRRERHDRNPSGRNP